MNIAALIILAVVAAFALAWLAIRYAHLIAGDGYGHRPIPRSHYDRSAPGR